MRRTISCVHRAPDGFRTTLHTFANDSELGKQLDSYRHAALTQHLEQPARELLLNASARRRVGRGERIAVLLTGALRTSLLAPAFLADLGAWLSALRVRGSVHVFAYLNLHSSEARGSSVFRTDKMHNQNSRQEADDLYDRTQSPREAQKALEDAFMSWRVPITLESHSEDHPLLPGACAPSAHATHWITWVHQQSEQMRKVAAATAMMGHEEARVQAPFDVVIRLRPDLCLQSARRLLDFAFRHTWATSAWVLMACT